MEGKVKLIRIRVLLLKMLGHSIYIYVCVTGCASVRVFCSLRFDSKLVLEWPYPGCCPTNYSRISLQGSLVINDRITPDIERASLLHCWLPCPS